MKKIMKNFFEPSTQRLLYSLLLIATPFLLLQNYLQSFIGELSEIKFTFFKISVAAIPAIVLLFIVVLIVLLRKKITLNRIFGWTAIVLLFWLGQYLSDFYFHHRFYDLQFNWHYLAYGIFSYLNYRYLKNKKKSRAKILLNTFFTAFFISLFDELIQIPLSNRVFDISDVAKDLWGTFIGLTFVFSNELTVYFYLFFLALFFLCFASVLTDTGYIFQAFAFPIIIFAVFFLLIYFWQFKAGKWLVSLFLVLLFTGLGFLQVKYHNKGIVGIDKHLFIYNGIPVFYFDVMIFPDGTFRLVDKKEFFNERDKKTIKRYAGDILIVSSGTNGRGAGGFIDRKETGFVYNEFKNKGMQVIVQDNFLAFQTFNSLKQMNKNVTFIIKND